MQLFAETPHYCCERSHSLTTPKLVHMLLCKLMWKYRCIATELCANLSGRGVLIKKKVRIQVVDGGMREGMENPAPD